MHKYGQEAGASASLVKRLFIRSNKISPLCMKQLRFYLHKNLITKSERRRRVLYLLEYGRKLEDSLKKPVCF
jgi:hypothetical protein